MGLESVIHEVRRDGEAKANQVLADAKAQANAILQAARDQAKAHEAARLAAAEKEAHAIASQSASRAESEARKAVLGAEAGLREELKRTILQGLNDLPQKTREAHLKQLLQKAHAIIPKGSVWGASQDTAVLHAQKTYKHAGSLAIAGGIVVESESGDARLDLSYETLLEDAWRDILKAEAGLFH